MSTRLVRAEISRFLGSNVPEVLCIRGKWGVGKTYAWMTFLAAAQEAGSVVADDYAYVSLFGLNSLDELRFSIAVNTVSTPQAATGADFGSLTKISNRALDYGRKAGPLIRGALSAWGAGGASAELLRAAFLLVKNQVVCLDDLERAGDGLKQRDILGLVSFLKEQRRCKVVLLLNETELKKDERADFEKLLEKVVDISLVFHPTAAEAAEIALPSDGKVGPALAAKTVALGMVNIRVIKKIERLALVLETLLQGYHAEVFKQAISTLALGGQAYYQPGDGPSLDYIRQYNSGVEHLHASQNKISENALRWHGYLQEYGFSHTDVLDAAIFDALVSGFVDEDALKAAANILQTQILNNSRTNSFSEAWDRYHHSLTVDDDYVLDGIRDGALENLAVISPVNLSSAAIMLREHGREAEADDIIDKYVALDWPRSFFDVDAAEFFGSTADPRLIEGLAARRESFIDARTPREVLDTVTERRAWSDYDIERLAKVTPDEFEALFESIEGPELRRSVKRVLEMASSTTDTRLRTAAIAGLRKIAAKSPLRERRVASYGVSLNDEQAGPIVQVAEGDDRADR